MGKNLESDRQGSLRIGVTLVLWAGLVVLAGCRGRVRPDAAEGFGTKAVSLKGTYGVARGGVIEPVLKVEEGKAGYVFEERTAGSWRVDAETAHVATEEEVKQALGVAQVGFPVFGLATTQALLMKGPAGWKVAPTGGAEVETKSGYLLVSGGVMVAAQKVEMGGR